MDYVRTYKSFINSHNLSDAVRITVGIILPAIILGYFFNYLSAGIVVSLGAMCVGNADNPGPIHHRRNGMIACTIIIFLVSLLTGLTIDSPVLLGALIFLFCFLFSLISVYGNRASSIGISALLVMVLNIDRRYEGSQVLINRRADGVLEIREDLIFHGGSGATLEMREFGARYRARAAVRLRLDGVAEAAGYCGFASRICP